MVHVPLITNLKYALQDLNSLLNACQIKDYRITKTAVTVWCWNTLPRVTKLRKSTNCYWFNSVCTKQNSSSN